MLLSLTPLEEAWKNSPSSNNNSTPRQTFLQQKQEQQTHQEQTNSSDGAVVEALNSGNTYDNMVINVDSFHPTRIDVVITDPTVIEHMKHIPYTQQKELATKVLLAHFEAYPNTEKQLRPNSSNTVVIPSTSTSGLHMNSTPSNIEFYRGNDNKGQAGGPTNTMLSYIILVMLCYVLYERIKSIWNR